MENYDRLVLEVELKKKQLSISRALTAKEEIDVKLLEKELDVAKMKEHSKLQDETISKLKEEIKEIQRKISTIDSNIGK